MYGNGPYSVTKAAIVSLMECLYGQLRDEVADIAASLGVDIEEGSARSGGVVRADPMC